MRGFLSLTKKQKELKERLTDPITEFKRSSKITRIERFRNKCYIFVILSKKEEVLYVGRASHDLADAFLKMAFLTESAVLELLPFDREDAAIAFAKRLIRHFKPKFNGDNL